MLLNLFRPFERKRNLRFWRLLRFFDEAAHDDHTFSDNGDIYSAGDAAASFSAHLPKLSLKVADIGHPCFFEAIVPNQFGDAKQIRLHIAGKAREFGLDGVIEKFY